MRDLGEMLINTLGSSTVVDPERAILATVIIVISGGIIFFVRNSQGLRRLLGHEGK